jgi:hypothetical protein
VDATLVGKVHPPLSHDGHPFIQWVDDTLVGGCWFSLVVP